MTIPITQVPQADELQKVILTVESVYNDNVTDSQIANYVGFTDRQGRYYRLAAEILGLLVNHKNNAILTTSGEEFIILDEENRTKKIRTILKENELFKLVLNEIDSSNDGLNRGEILSFLLKIIDGSESTITRRYNTVINWLTSSSLLKLDFRKVIDDKKEEETVYKINDQLDETDFWEEPNVNDSIYPANYSNEELDIKENHMQVVSLVRKKEQGKILVPDFQRNQVWKPQQKSRFIESLILNIPVPPFYMSQDIEGKMIIVDGLQRSSAIFDFLSNKYKLVGLEALPALNGKLYNDLDGELKARIEDRELLLYILKPSVPLSIVYDIFNRINSNGTPLTRQEIRNCIYIGNSTRILAKLANSEIFKKAVNNGISPRRMKDREAILRFFAFSGMQFDEYRGDLDDFLGNTMKRMNRMTEYEITHLESRFIRAMTLTLDFFGNKNFRLINENNKGPINVALFEVVSTFFDQKNDRELIENKDYIINKYFNILLKDAEFRDAIKTSTSNERNVKTRFNKIFTTLSL
jgi:hypothetical protein